MSDNFPFPPRFFVQLLKGGEGGLMYVYPNDDIFYVFGDVLALLALQALQGSGERWHLPDILDNISNNVTVYTITVSSYSVRVHT